MNITVYDNFKKAVNSTKQPSGGRTISVRLKDNCSVVNPVFRIKSNDKNINYVKWDNNYYNVDNVEFLANEEIAIHCTRDAMATFKSDIGSSAQYVVRSASQYNELICDTKYPTYNNAHVKTLLLSGLQNQISTTGTVVIGIANTNSHNAVTYYAFDPSSSQFQNILSYMFSDAWLDGGGDLSIELQKELINPFQYIVSAMWLPIAKSNIATYTDLNVKFGWWETHEQADAISAGERVYSEIAHTTHLPRHDQASTNGMYMNGAPFTSYTLNCWTFGDVPIDPAPFIGNDEVTIMVVVDLYTGVAELKVTTSQGTVIARQTGQMGVPFQLSQVSRNYLQAAVTTVGAVSGAVTSFGAGNVVGGVVGMAQGITSGIANSMPHIQTVGSTGSKAPFYYRPTIVGKYYNQVPTDNINMGRPLMGRRTISSLSGYIECDNVDLITSATPEEKNEIIRYMTSGFFYE